MIEKRLLMKFITTCLEDECEKEAEMSFGQYLENFNLTQRLHDYILNAIAMCKCDFNANEGIKKCKKYFKSIGRYGDSPFLFLIYGTNELSQAFARLSAVFGGIFYLNLELCSIKWGADENEVVVNLVNEKEKHFKCKNLVTNLNYLNYEVIERHDLAKCVLITNKSFFNSNDEVRK